MKIFTGTVTRQKDTTARVSVGRTIAHPVYKKRVKRTKNYLVHDEMGTQVGQSVRFVASKPYSKMKKWKIIEIVGVKKEEAKGKEPKPQAKKLAKEKTVRKPKAKNAKK